MVQFRCKMQGRNENARLIQVDLIAHEPVPGHPCWKLHQLMTLDDERWIANWLSPLINDGRCGPTKRIMEHLFAQGRRYGCFEPAPSIATWTVYRWIVRDYTETRSVMLPDGEHPDRYAPADFSRSVPGSWLRQYPVRFRDDLESVWHQNYLRMLWKEYGWDHWLFSAYTSAFRTGLVLG